MGMAISNYVMARIPKITAKSISKAIEKLERQRLPITNRAIIRVVGWDQMRLLEH